MSRLLRLGVCSWFLWTCSFQLQTQTAAAQSVPEPITLDWSAPQSCPDSESVRAMLRERLPAEHANVPLHARAHVTQEAHGFRLDVELAPSGQAAPAKRTLRNAQCGQLAEAAVVLIGLAVSASANESTEPAPTAEAVTAPPAARESASEKPRPQVSEAPNTAPAGTPPQVTGSPAGEDVPEPEQLPPDSVLRGVPRPLHLQLSAAARSAIGVFPQAVALGVQAQLAARIAPLYAALGLSFWLPSEARSSSYPRAMLRGSGLFADGSLGADVVTFPWLVLTPALCLELGQLTARAVGVNGPETSRTLWLAAGASLGLSFPIFERWAIALDAAALSPLTRIVWLVRAPGGDVEAFTAAPFAARFALRVAYTFL